MAQTTGVLKITCPDRRGLVASVTSFLAEHGANILDSNQHSDPNAGVFFMRVAFDLTGMTLSRPEIAPAFEAVARHFKMDWQLRFDDELKNVAILVSQQDHCLYDLLLRHRAGEFKANIALVISNHTSLEPVVRSFGLDWHFLPTTPATKAQQEAKILALLNQRQIDLVVLARYMQILPLAIVEPFRWRIINIHHSLLPAFAGAKPYHQAYERSVKIIGATAHYVTEALDEGPIIAQDVAKVSHRDSVSDLVRRGRDLERQVLAQAVKAHLEDRVLVSGRRAIVFE